MARGRQIKSIPDMEVGKLGLRNGSIAHMLLNCLNWAFPGGGP